MSKLFTTNCINYALVFLNKNPNLLDYIKNFNEKHNTNRTGFLYNNSEELKIIRKELFTCSIYKVGSKNEPTLFF